MSYSKTSEFIRFKEFAVEQQSILLGSLSQNTDFSSQRPRMSSTIASHFKRQFKDLLWNRKKRSLQSIVSLCEPAGDWQTISYNDIPFLQTQDDSNYMISSDRWLTIIPDNLHNYCGKERLDTRVAGTFCKVLKKCLTCEGLCIVDPHIWESCIEKIGIDFEFSHSVYADGVLEIHIGVLDDGHFFSIHAYIGGLHIYIMDSLHDDLAVCHKLHVSVLIRHLYHHHNINMDAWSILFVVDNPKQSNSYDCGVFMLKALECWIKKVKLPFSKDNAQNARHFLLAQVGAKDLQLPPRPDPGHRRGVRPPRAQGRKGPKICPLH
ncbi:uncharacterized protein [Spinacia oleracea]|uniref:Uncharacterized protein LOC110775482 n=1 Tax=Spinacia oleracea TaxID=3562 RepID=A0A9R0HS02_SPIOL|nr:uncharacterized protein LOC110775482 [Spinacia oleracea]XP_056684311.1 uncharacterized protein LOC130460786 [Spinacia oleracea]XP_056684312.1 uncharacterized protein LOC130460787 [Spinacia oleracea]